MLYLHIGLHKTGSTALQTFLRDHGSVLDAMRVSVLQAGRNDFGVRKHDRIISTRGAEASAVRAAIAAEVGAASAQGRALLASSEMFHRARIARVLDPLSGVAVRPVVWLRRQDHYLEALYQQQVSHGEHARSISEEWERLRSVGELNHRSLVENWAGTSGVDGCLVAAYPPRASHEPGFSIIADLCRLLATDRGYAGPVDLPDVPVREVEANRSVDTITVLVMSAALRAGTLNADANMDEHDGERRHLPRARQYRQWRLRYSTRPVDHRSILRAGDRRRVLSEHQDANRDLAEAHRTTFDRRRFQGARIQADPEAVGIDRFDRIVAELADRFTHDDYQAVLSAAPGQVTFPPISIDLGPFDRRLVRREIRDLFRHVRSDLDPDNA